MKGQLKVETPAEYIAAVDDKRRSDIAALDALIRKHAPKLEPVIMGGMLGYGPFHYRYASGREGDACKLSIASNASYISLYCFAADARGFVAGRYVDRLPKASIGKSCVRFKKLADLDEKALVALINETAKMSLRGLITPGHSAKRRPSLRGRTPRSGGVGLGRIELPTSSLSGMRSNRLSYSPVLFTG